MNKETLFYKMWNLNKKKLPIYLLTILVIVVAGVVAAIPGALLLMRRADAQVALGNAKSLRIALQVAARESYALDTPFCDFSGRAGVTEEVWQRVITDSKVPGDFWVLQMEEGGFEVQRFLYQEGDFTVIYCKDPLSYHVYYQQAYIETENAGKEGR